MSKKIFSAQEWENAPSKQETLPPSLQTNCSHSSATDLSAEIDRVVQEIENRGIDIAPDYTMWVNVGFALADGLGEQGREFFHRISQLPSRLCPSKHRQSVYSLSEWKRFWCNCRYIFPLCYSGRHRTSPLF